MQSKDICVIARKDFVTPQRGCPEMVDAQPSAENGDNAKSNDLERNLPLSRHRAGWVGLRRQVLCGHFDIFQRTLLGRKVPLSFQDRARHLSNNTTFRLTTLRWGTYPLCLSEGISSVEGSAQTLYWPVFRARSY